MATPIAIPPVSTDWLADGKWIMNPGFEPFGASNKRVNYQLDPNTLYRIGIVHNVNGKFQRFFTDPLLGSDIGTLPPGATVIEPEQNIPLSQRDYEWWLFQGAP